MDGVTIVGEGWKSEDGGPSPPSCQLCECSVDAGGMTPGCGACGFVHGQPNFPRNARAYMPYLTQGTPQSLHCCPCRMNSRMAILGVG